MDTITATNKKLTQINVSKTLGLNSTAGELAKQLILQHFEDMTSYIDGIVENRDIEPVHKFRVASRRLRAVLKTFGSVFPQKEIENFISLIRRLASFIGEARDLDVSIIFLREYIQKIPLQDQKGVKTYLNDIQKMRKEIQPLIVDDLTLFQQSTYTEKFYSYFTQINPKSLRKFASSEQIAFSKGNQTAINSLILVSQAANQVISNCINELWSFDKMIYERKNRKILHKMRIATKNLRYNMELFIPFYPDIYNDYLNNIKTVQDYLGTIHDRDVQICTIRKKIRNHFNNQSKHFQTIEKQIKDQTILQNDVASLYKESIRNDIRGIKRLLQDQIIYREQHYKSFIVYWKKLSSDGFPDVILKVINSKSDK